MAEPEDLTQVFVNISVSVTDELLSRVEADLSEPDLVAISTAVNKAALRAARVVANAIESTSPLTVNLLGGEGEEVDLWAEEFGEAEQ